MLIGTAGAVNFFRRARQPGATSPTRQPGAAGWIFIVRVAIFTGFVPTPQFNRE